MRQSCFLPDEKVGSIGFGLTSVDDGSLEIEDFASVPDLVAGALCEALSKYITNAFMEGLNSVFSATKRKARGYRSGPYLITMLYFVAGKLRLPQT